MVERSPEAGLPARGDLKFETVINLPRTDVLFAAIYFCLLLFIAGM